MEIRKYVHTDKIAIHNLYADSTANEQPYKPLLFNEFEQTVFKNKNFDNEGCFTAWQNEQLVGVIVSFVNKNDLTTGYISLLLVAIDKRNQKIGSSLLAEAEYYLKKKSVSKIRFGYTGQMNFPWYIPRTNKHDHAGAPGVIINSDLYFLLYKSGYHVSDLCDAFHLNLDEFSLQDKVKETIYNNKDNLKIEFYDNTKHYGLDDFYKAISDYLFEEVIKANLALEKPNPFLVITENNRIVGWTGALYPEVSGRAHFDGIIIAPEIRGKKMGKALFSMLAIKSYELKATYMSFFTNLSNPARYIYLSLGFRIIQSFAIMDKKI